MLSGGFERYSLYFLYSAIGAAAVRFMPAASYTVLVLGLTGILITPVVLGRYGWRPVRAEWRARWLRIVLVGGKVEKKN